MSDAFWGALALFVLFSAIALFLIDLHRMRTRALNDLGEWHNVKRYPGERNKSYALRIYNRAQITGKRPW